MLITYNVVRACDISNAVNWSRVCIVSEAIGTKGTPRMPLDFVWLIDECVGIEVVFNKFQNLRGNQRALGFDSVERLKGRNAVDSVQNAWLKMGAYRYYNIVASSHRVRNAWMRCVESFLNNSDKRGGVVRERLKRVRRKKKEVGKSGEKNLGPGRLRKEEICKENCAGDGDMNRGNRHNRVGDGSDLVVCQSSDLHLRFLGCFVLGFVRTGLGNIVAGTGLIFVSNKTVMKMRCTYNHNPTVVPLNDTVDTGQTNQLLLHLSELAMRHQTRTHLVPPVAIPLQARWDSGYRLGTDWSEHSWTLGHNMVIVQATNGRFRDEVAHCGYLCTGLVVCLWEEVCW